MKTKSLPWAAPKVYDACPKCWCGQCTGECAPIVNGPEDVDALARQGTPRRENKN